MENESKQDHAIIAIVTHGEELWGAERLRRILSDAGFRVLSVEAGDMQNTFQKKRPAIVIANLAGGSSGDLEFCRKLSQFFQAPIVAIGSSRDENTIVSMIEAVVDDYMVRPVNPLELVARVHSILRRTPVGVWSDVQRNVPQEPQPAGRSKRGYLSIFYRMKHWISKYRGLS
jgi:DNA-binding response OmpR family regulator